MDSERTCNGPGCAAPGPLNNDGLCLACASLPAHTLQHIRTLADEVVRLRVQLAGCSVAALGATRNPAKPGDYGWSQSYEDTLRLRVLFDKLLDALKEAHAGDRRSINTLIRLLSKWEEVRSCLNLVGIA